MPEQAESSSDHVVADIIHDPLTARRAALVAFLVAVPFAAYAVVPLYSHEKPHLFGFPFFYWYQIAWVLATPVFLWSAYRLVCSGRGERP